MSTKGRRDPVSRFRAIAVWLVATATFASLPGAISLASGAGCDGKVTTLGRGWIAVDGPALVAPLLPDPFARGLEQLLVDPKDPKRIYVTDSHSLHRTVDGGCTWEEVYKVGASSTGPTQISGSSAIHSLELGAKKHLYLIVTHQSGNLTASVSPDGGDTWRDASLGLPVSGGIYYESLAASPSDPNVAYLGVESAGIGIGPTRVDADTVYGTSNGGALWEARTSTQSRMNNFLQDGDVQLRVDPADPNRVWSFAQDSVTRLSEDGGANWVANQAASTASSSGFVDIDLAERPKGPSLVVGTPYMLTRENPFLLRSEDYGLSFAKFHTPDVPWGVSLGPKAGQMALTTANEQGIPTLWRLDARVNKWVDISPPGVELWYDVYTSTKGKKTQLVAFDASKIYVYTKGI